MKWDADLVSGFMNIMTPIFEQFGFTAQIVGSVGRGEAIHYDLDILLTQNSDKVDVNELEYQMRVQRLFPVWAYELSQEDKPRDFMLCATWQRELAIDIYFAKPTPQS